MGKIESLERLERLGFNVPRKLITIDGHSSQSMKKNKWEIFRKSLKTLGPEKISIRTEIPGFFKTPHFPNISITRADKEIKALLNSDHFIYIFEGIDPSDCEYRGNIVFTKRGALILEYLTGPGTVRDLEHQVPKLFKLDNPYPSLDYVELKQVIERVSLVKNKLIDQIVEWSLYKNPVGKLKQEDIYWEIRPWH